MSAYEHATGCLLPVDTVCAAKGCMMMDPRAEEAPLVRVDMNECKYMPECWGWPECGHEPPPSTLPDTIAASVQPPSETLKAKGARLARLRGISLVRLNAEKDPKYCPYCMRCDGATRMQLVEPFFWRCPCGAVHDERTAAEREPDSSLRDSWTRITHADLKKIREERDAAIAKWQRYEEHYVLPCFTWAREAGIDLQALVSGHAGRNCIDLLIHALIDRVRALTVDAEQAQIADVDRRAAAELRAEISHVADHQMWLAATASTLAKHRMFAIAVARGMTSPWPPRDVVDKLAEAVSHLLADHDCDAHGHETYKSALDKAHAWLRGDHA